MPAGAYVRYRGSLTDEHGYYRVAARLGNGRYHLVDGTGRCPEGQSLYSVGRASIVVVETVLPECVDPEEIG